MKNWSVCSVKQQGFCDSVNLSSWRLQYFTIQNTVHIAPVKQSRLYGIHHVEHCAMWGLHAIEKLAWEFAACFVECIVSRTGLSAQGKVLLLGGLQSMARSSCFPKRRSLSSQCSSSLPSSAASTVHQMGVEWLLLVCQQLVMAFWVLAGWAAFLGDAVCQLSSARWLFLAHGCCFWGSSAWLSRWAIRSSRCAGPWTYRAVLQALLVGWEHGSFSLLGCSSALSFTVSYFHLASTSGVPWCSGYSGQGQQLAWLTLPAWKDFLAVLQWYVLRLS